MQVKSPKHYWTRAVLERRKKPWQWETKWRLQTSMEYPCIDRTEKKRCEGTIGDNKNVDRLKVWSCAVKELKRTGEKGRWWITKVMRRDPSWCQDKRQKQRWKLKNREVQRRRDAKKAFCASWFEYCSLSDLGDVVFGDSSLGLAGAGGDGSSSRS